MSENILDIFLYDRKLYEEVSSKKRPGVLRVIRGPVAEWDNLNRNRRLYTEKLWDKVLSSSYVKEQLMYKTLFGECNHPESRFEVDFSRVSHVIWDMWKVPESNQVYAEIAILDTPLGRILNTLYEAGGIIGYSSRAGGTLHQRKDYVEVDERDYNFVTFDAVPYPSVVAARPQEVLESVVEGLKEELPDNIHEKLCAIIKESGSENKDVIKDFIYSIKGFNMDKEIQLLESASVKEEIVPEPVENKTESRSLETTLSLLKESSSQINDLRVSNQTLTADNVALKAENEALKKNLNESLGKITELMTDSSNLSKNLNISESRFNDTINDLRSRIDKLNSIIEDKDLEISELSDVREACRVLRQENEGMKSSLQTISESKSEIESSISENAKIRNELKEAYSEISSMVSESSNKDTEIQELTECVKDLQKQLEEAKKVVPVVESVDNSELEGLKLKNAELEAKIKNLSESVDTSNSTRAAVQERCKQYKEDLVSIICSGYNLNPADVMGKLPAGFTKSDVYCVCEGMNNASQRGVDFDSVMITESSSVSENVDNPSPNTGSIQKYFGNNRRGIGAIL